MATKLVHGNTLADKKFLKAVREGAEARPFIQAPVQLAFERYGAYLELVGHDEPVGEARVFEFVTAEPVDYDQENADPEPAA